MSRRNNKYWDEDDLDDEWEEDVYDEEAYDEYDEAPPPPKPPAAGKPASAKAASKQAPKQPAAPAAAAGASALARALVDPPPQRPDGTRQRGVKPLPQAERIKQQPHRLVPEAAAAAAESSDVQRFAFDQPSPDDVVLAAQQNKGVAGKGLGRPAAKQQQQQQQRRGDAQAAAGLSAGVRGLNLNGQQPTEGAVPSADAAAPQQAAAPRRRRPLAEYQPEGELAAECAAAAAAEAAGGGAKPRLHLVVLGHVDAGKSTLMGRTLYELGLLSERTVQRTQREAAASGKASFAWAWMLDERPEERARGVTVDVAVSRFETPERSVTLLDAPGHREFVPNMIAGAAQADAALLIVDGSPGGFEAGFAAAAPGSPAGGGQTREHAQLARSLGIEQVAVVVTKLDTCEYSQQRFDDLRAQLEPFLRGCGFREASLQWLPAVGPTGDNLAQPPAEPRLAAWWRGPTLVQAIDAFKPASRLLNRPLRLPLADVSRAGKQGVTVSGKLEGGALRVGSRVLAMPAGQAATVKALEVDGKPASLARAGDSAEVTLAGIDAAALGAGSVLCHPDFPVPLAARFEAQVVVLDVVVPILRGQQVITHAHTARESGHVSALVSLLNGKTGEVQRAQPRCLLKGQAAVVEVSPTRPLCLESYADYRALGRVALRDGGRTIAVGVVTRVLEAGEG